MNRYQFFTGLASVALLSACANSFSGASSKTDPLDLITAQALEAHMRFLADDSLEGRMTGTQGYAIAANYVEAQFRAIGLAPGTGNSYLQQVPYTQSQLDLDEVQFSVIGKNDEQPMTFRQDFVTGADKVRDEVAVRAPAVFVGYGVHAPELGHDDYADVDINGKVIVMFSGAPRRFDANPRAYYSSGREKARAAVARGAVGVIGIRKQESIDRYNWADITRNAGTLPSMGWLAADGSASSYFPEIRMSVSLSEAAAPALFQDTPHSYQSLVALENSNEPLPHFELAVEVSASQRALLSSTISPNVVGLLPGSDPLLKNEVIVYTAHLDHIGRGAPVDGDDIYNGAYDNAMGIALMIEAARALAANPPKRSFLFVAVGGEERGLLGSDYFAHHPTVPIERIVANVNLDMPLFIFPLADVVAFGEEHSNMSDAIRASVEAEGMVLTPDPMPEEVIFLRSDQYSLVRKGVPAVYLIPGFTSSDPNMDGDKLSTYFLQHHYHQPSDDLSLPVHWDSAVHFARANVRIGQRIGNAAQKPDWKPGNFFAEKFAGGR